FHLLELPQPISNKSVEFPTSYKHQPHIVSLFFALLIDSHAHQLKSEHNLSFRLIGSKHS
ncbi:hypothetical protein P9Z79_16230, partial [Bacillus cereus]|nr:hypothetical protein [Bacillus cereus]